MLADRKLHTLTILFSEQHLATVQYKILEGAKFGEFGEMQEIRQNFLV